MADVGPDREELDIILARYNAFGDPVFSIYRPTVLWGHARKLRFDIVRSVFAPGMIENYYIISRPPGIAPLHSYTPNEVIIAGTLCGRNETRPLTQILPSARNALGDVGVKIIMINKRSNVASGQIIEYVTIKTATEYIDILRIHSMWNMEILPNDEPHVQDLKRRRVMALAGIARNPRGVTVPLATIMSVELQNYSPLGRGFADLFPYNF